MPYDIGPKIGIEGDSEIARAECDHADIKSPGQGNGSRYKFI